MADPLTGRTLSGRFYRLARPGGAEAFDVSSALDAAWKEDQGRGKAFSRGLCTGTPPHDGVLEIDPDELVYSSGGSGFLRMWLREEVRTAGRAACTERAARLARQADEDTSLVQLCKSDRSGYMDLAREQLLRQAVPTVRIVPMILSKEWLWVGRRGAAKDTTLTPFLHPILGALRVDPLLWGRGEGGWHAISYATLLRLVDVEGGQLDDDVVLLELDTKGSSLQCRVQGTDDATRSVLGQLAKSGSDNTVKRMCFEVYHEGSQIRLDADAEGLYSVQPPRSPGGLPAERLRRRFDDALLAARRVREVMEACRVRLEESVL